MNLKALHMFAFLRIEPYEEGKSPAHVLRASREETMRKNGS